MHALVLFAALLGGQQTPPPDIEQALRESRAASSRGDFEAARRVLEEAWKQAEQLPQQDARRYDVAKQLTAVMAAAADYDAAENWLQIAINWRERKSGFTAELAPDLIELALLCRARQEYERGLTVLRRTFELYLPRGGADDPATADILSLMGLLEMDRRHFEEAVPRLEMALKVRARELGDGHSALLPDLDRLGSSLIAVRDYPRAEGVFRQSLAIREHLNGRVSIELVPSLDGLAYALFGQKKYQEGEVVYKRLVAVWEIAAGTEHPMIPLSLDKLAVFYREQQRWDEAQGAADRANAIRRLILAGGLFQEAEFQASQGAREEAESLYRQALALARQEEHAGAELRKKIEAKLAEFAPKKPPPRRMPPRVPKPR